VKKNNYMGGVSTQQSQGDWKEDCHNENKAILYIQTTDPLKVAVIFPVPLRALIAHGRRQHMRCLSQFAGVGESLVAYAAVRRGTEHSLPKELNSSPPRGRPPSTRPMHHPLFILPFFSQIL